MRFFWYFNFAYRWSFLNNYNTAIMGFNKQIDSSIIDLINTINRNESSIYNLIIGFHPESLSKKVASLNKGESIYDYKPLVPLHSHFFDGAWLCNDGCSKRLTNISVCGFNEFYTRTFMSYSDFRIENFFEGAYAYHLHFKPSSIHEYSYFAYFENYFLEKKSLY